MEGFEVASSPSMRAASLAAMALEQHLTLWFELNGALLLFAPDIPSIF